MYILNTNTNLILHKWKQKLTKIETNFINLNIIQTNKIEKLAMLPFFHLFC